jgi:PTH2 family peptidyl-tRNA hydrolase
MYKQVIVVRKDLKLGVGKIASHVAHASLGSLRQVAKNVISKWEGQGAKKVVLKVNSEKELKNLYKKIVSKKIPCFLVRDAGLTQLKPRTITCLGIGPVEEKKIDEITGKLKLL